jgi:hypothetical protein
LRPIEKECLGLLRRLPKLGLGEVLMATRLLAEVLARPHVARTVVAQVMAYLQLRYLLDRGGFWQPELAKLSGPRFARCKPSTEAALELVDRSAA